MSDTRVCVYCKRPVADHGNSGVGPCWRRCPDGTDRLVHLDSHFQPPPLAVCERCGSAVPHPAG